MPKFQVEVDAIKTQWVTLYVEAETFDEAFEKWRNNEYELEDPADEVVLDEASYLDLRTITNLETGKVLEYV